MSKKPNQEKKLIIIVQSVGPRVIKKIWSKQELLNSFQSKQSINDLYDMDDITELIESASDASDEIGNGSVTDRNSFIKYAENSFDKNEFMTILHLEEGQAINIIITPLDLKDTEQL